MVIHLLTMFHITTNYYLLEHILAYIVVIW